MTDPFLEHRRRQEKEHLRRIKNSSDPMASLISVELNVMDACNRQCSFCPHVDPGAYPNEYGWRMELAITEKVVRDLAGCGYKGRFSFSGYGEPLLNKQLVDHVARIRETLPDNVIEVNTNGDPLLADTATKMFDAGLTYLYINLYDGPHQIEWYENLMELACVGRDRYFLRPHWDADNDWGLTLNNRSGTVPGMEIEEPITGSKCHYLFYKAFIDWQGDLLFCSNDWGREIVVGNLLQQNFVDIWLSEQMKELRWKLFNGDRSLSPCSKCNIDGTLHGQTSIDLLAKYYSWKSND